MLRYSALAFGALYGFYHQSSISASEKLQAINQQYERKVKLIEEAKAEFKKKNMPQESKTAGGGSRFSLPMRSPCECRISVQRNAGRHRFPKQRMLTTRLYSNHGPRRPQIRFGSLLEHEGGGEAIEGLADGFRDLDEGTALLAPRSIGALELRSNVEGETRMLSVPRWKFLTSLCTSCTITE